MIAKILKRGNNFYSVANYNHQKVKKGTASIIAAQHIMGKKPIQLEAYFQQVSQFSKTKKPVFHLALSFSEKDKSKLNDAKMTAISQDYLQQMGYGNYI